MAVAVPKGRRQTLRYGDGTSDEMDVPLGTTAFASGETMYELLSDQEKAFARSTKVEYAPHPYVWMAKARALSDGTLELLSNLHLLWDIAEDEGAPLTTLSNSLTGALASLGLYSDNLEQSLDDLPAWDPAAVQTLPLV